MSYSFDYQFYTCEFDQEMLDFISGIGMSVVNDNEWSVGHENLYYGTGVNCFWTDDDTDCSNYHYKTKQEFKQLIGMADSQPTYTKSELSYISELEGEVAKLQELCSDYVSEIEQLRGITIQPEELKPISDMTIEDWQQALDEGWKFQTTGKGEVTVKYLVEDDANYGLLLRDDDECYWWVALDGVDHDQEGWSVVRRIK